jgi:ribonuclease HI
MTLPSSIKLYFDGSVTKNPGGIAGYGWRICDENDQEIISDRGEICRGKEATNNIGEWGAIAKALQYLKEINWKGKLQIYGDSQLVINQLNGIYKVKKDTLIPYYTVCRSLLENLDWSAEWIPREKNKLCDKLSKIKEKSE